MPEQQLRILQVNTEDAGGGAEGSAWNLFQAYPAHGHQSWLAVGRQRTTNPNVFLIPNQRYHTAWARFWFARSNQLKPYLGKIKGLGRLYTGLRLLGEPRRIPGWLRGWEDFDYPGTQHLLDLPPVPPNILHCHNLHGGYFDLTRLPGLSQKLPVILNLRDAWLLSGHCAHSLDCQRWRTGCGQCPHLGTYPAVMRDATAFNWQRKQSIFASGRFYITTVSQWLMDKVRASMMQGVQYRVIPNAINLDIYRPGAKLQARQLLGLPPQAKIVLFTAHNGFKDYATMKQAVALLQASPATPLLFICLGRRDTSAPCGQGRMLYPGFVWQPEQMALYYQAADVYLHAALDEAFGKSVAEAMACAIPVVATAVGGISEQIEHERTGFLTPFRDAPALAHWLQKLLDDAELAAKIGQAATQSAQQRFGLERQVRDFLEWYAEILDGWPVTNLNS